MVSFSNDVSIGCFEGILAAMKQRAEVSFNQVLYEKIGKSSSSDSPALLDVLFFLLENRKLGVVAAVRCSLRLGKGQSKFNFVLFEEVLRDLCQRDIDEIEDLEENYPKVRLLRFNMDISTHQSAAPLKDLLSFFSELLDAVLQERRFQCYIRCYKCKAKSWFLAKTNFQPDELEICTMELHDFPSDHPIFACVNKLEPFVVNPHDLSTNDSDNKELLNKGHDAPKPIKELLNSICLLSIPNPTAGAEEKSFGTAFLCTLGQDFDYKVALLTAGHNFPCLKGKTVLDDDYPLEKYEMIFGNVEGVINNDESKQYNIKKFNLAEFLSREGLNVKKVFADPEKELSDFAAFLSNINEDYLNKEFGLNALPIRTQMEGCMQLNIYGHSAEGTILKPGENMPLRHSTGDKVDARCVLEKAEDQIKKRPYHKKELDKVLLTVQKGVKVYYTNDTLNGMSGAPVIAEFKDGGQYSSCVVGIHNGGVSERIRPYINNGQTIASVIESFKSL